jgi:hypothetical protein
VTINSRTKGAVGEREFATLLRERGYRSAKRGQQFRGGGDSPDVVGIEGVHLELKRAERFNLHDAVNQARRDANGSGMPVVAHRCNATRKTGDCRGEWLFVLGAEDFFALLAAAGYGPPLLTAEDLI